MAGYRALPLRFHYLVISSLFTVAIKPLCLIIPWHSRLIFSRTEVCKMLSAGDSLRQVIEVKPRGRLPALGCYVRAAFGRSNVITNNVLSVCLKIHKDNGGGGARTPALGAH